MATWLFVSKLTNIIELNNGTDCLVTKLFTSIERRRGNVPSRMHRNLLRAQNHCVGESEERGRVHIVQKATVKR